VELTESIKSLYSQAVSEFPALTIYAGVAILFVIVCCLLVKECRKNKVLNYYTNIIRTISRSIFDNHEIVAFNDSDEVIYATHPGSYMTKQEFFKEVSSRVVSIDSLKTFIKMMDAKQPYSMILNCSGKGLKNQWGKSMIDCSFVKKEMSLIGEDVSVVVMSDVSKYFGDAEKVAEEYRQLEQFLDNFPCGIFYLNSDGVIVGTNLTFANLVRAGRDVVVGASIREFIDEFEPEMLAMHGHRIVKIKTKYSSDFEAFLFKSSTPSTSRAQPWMMLKISHAENSPQDKMFVFEETLKFIPIPTVITATNGDIKIINSAFATMLQDDVVLEGNKIKTNSNILDLIDDSEFIKSLNRISEFRGRSAPAEVRFVKSDTTAISHASRIGKEGFWLIQFCNVSRQKALEQHVIQSQRMQAIGQLTSGIVHDFNNLLTAMIGFSDLLLERYTPNELSYTDIVQIKQNAMRAANLVRHLLAFSKQQIPTPIVVSVEEIMLDMSSLLKKLVGSDIEFKMTDIQNIWPIKVDRTQLEQVIMNLCINAKDATKSGGNIIIKVANCYVEKSIKCVHSILNPGDYVLIEVIDTGSGMDSDIVENIFEPFYSGKQADECGTSGTGLGLATVYGIVSQMRGYIRVLTKPDIGSNFQIYVPKYAGTEGIRSQEYKKSPQDMSGTATILLVEDEDSVRACTARGLRMRGYKVIEADNGASALEIAKAQKFDLLVTDVVMPNMDGPTLNQKLREMFKDLRTIFVSGYMDSVLRESYKKCPNARFIQKPFMLVELMTEVKDILSDD
jgi:two-component system cell cycle sensor histidine kinase/response regulator CckA